jgi:hypothetical protein
MPVWDYPRDVGGAITGGFVYRGVSASALTGTYIFGDYVSGFIASLAYDGINPVVVTPIDTVAPYSLTSFGVGEDGELYFCTFGGSLFRFVSPPSSFAPATAKPDGFVLHQNFPNPFNATTRIAFTLASPGTVSLKVFDQAGREIETILQQSLPRGRHVVEWNAGTAASGLYYYRLEEFRTGMGETRAMLLVR